MMVNSRCLAGRWLVSLVAGLHALLLWLPSVQAAGLGISPTAVFFEGRQRSAEVIVINQSDRRGTYRVGFQTLQMVPDGSLDEDDAVSGSALDDLVRYAPRQMTLEPGQAQTVRLVLRKPAGLAPGEFRAHLRVAEIPPEDLGNDVERGTGEGPLSVRLLALFAVSIPVFVREGEIQVQAGLDQLQLGSAPDTGGASELDFRMTRLGNASVRGTLEAIFTPEGGAPEPVGLMKGLSVLYPLEARRARLPLRREGDRALGNGHLELRYTDGDEKRPRLLARAELAVP